VKSRDLFDELWSSRLAKLLIGQMELVEGVVIALFAEGSVLIEGPPGLGKHCSSTCCPKPWHVSFVEFSLRPT
jgi:hypothetical protein